MTRARTLLCTAGALVLTLCATARPSAASAASLQCGSNGGRGTISSDVAGSLVVPPGGWCSIHSGLTVHGSISVATGGRVDLHQDRVDDNVVLSSAAILTARSHTVIAGSVRMTHTDDVNLSETVIGGDLTGTMADDRAFSTMTVADGTVVTGDLDVTASGEQTFPSITLGGLSVGGSMRVTNVELSGPGPLDVTGSVTLNRLVAIDPSQLCRVHVRANLTVEYSAGTVQWGGYGACDEPNTIDGSLLVHDTTGLVHLAGPIGGDAVCRTNLHHPRPVRSDDPALAVTVSGRAIAQCAGLGRTA